MSKKEIFIKVPKTVTKNYLIDLHKRLLHLFYNCGVEFSGHQITELNFGVMTSYAESYWLIPWAGKLNLKRKNVRNYEVLKTKLVFNPVARSLVLATYNGSILINCPNVDTKPIVVDNCAKIIGAPVIPTIYLSNIGAPISL